MADLIAIAEHREHNFRKAFKAYDRDRSGAIDRDELALLLEDLQFSPDVVDEEFARADVTHSSTITFDEFCLYYNELLQRVAERPKVTSEDKPEAKSPELPPKPELIRFNSISDEIAAFERGEVVAPSTVVAEPRIPCKVCGRKFVKKSHARHEKICERATKNSKARGKFKVKRTRY